MEDFNLPQPTRTASRTRTVAVALVALLALGGGAIAWKMRVEEGAAGGGDPEREAMRAELLRLTAAESVFAATNRRYAASAAELATPVTSRIVVFASARDGYHIRISRPGTAVLCEVSAGRFAVAHAGWQLICGQPVAAGDRLVETPAGGGWTARAMDRVRSLFHEECDAACRQARLREGLKSPDRKALDRALEEF